MSAAKVAALLLLAAFSPFLVAAAVAAVRLLADRLAGTASREVDDWIVTVGDRTANTLRVPGPRKASDQS